jgi:type IV secretory pathway TrbL component
VWARIREGFLGHSGAEAGTLRNKILQRQMWGAMNTGIIDNFTNVFTTYVDSGFGLLKGEVAYPASILIVIDIMLAGLFWAWAPDEDVLARLVKKTLYIGFLRVPNW